MDNSYDIYVLKSWFDFSSCVNNSYYGSEAVIFNGGCSLSQNFFDCSEEGCNWISGHCYSENNSIEITRRINYLGLNNYQVLLNINVNENLDVFGIVEYFPETWNITYISKGGVLKDKNKIEWIAANWSNLTGIEIENTEISYNLTKNGPDSIFEGYWIGVNPDIYGVIGGQTSI